MAGFRVFFLRPLFPPALRLKGLVFREPIHHIVFIPHTRFQKQKKQKGHAQHSNVPKTCTTTLNPTEILGLSPLCSASKMLWRSRLCMLGSTRGKDPRV